MLPHHLDPLPFESLAFGLLQLSFQAVWSVEVALEGLAKLAVGSSFVVDSAVFVAAAAAVAVLKEPAGVVA